MTNIRLLARLCVVRTTNFTWQSGILWILYWVCSCSCCIGRLERANIAILVCVFCNCGTTFVSSFDRKFPLIVVNIYWSLVWPRTSYLAPNLATSPTKSNLGCHYLIDSYALWPPRLAIRREAIKFCNGFLYLPYFFISFSFYQRISLTAWIGSPNFQGSRLVSWDCTSFFRFSNFCRGGSWNLKATCFWTWSIFDCWRALASAIGTYVPCDHLFNCIHLLMTSYPIGNIRQWSQQTGSEWSDVWAIYRITVLTIADHSRILSNDADSEFKVLRRVGHQYGVVVSSRWILTVRDRSGLFQRSLDDGCSRQEMVLQRFLDEADVFSRLISIVWGLPSRIQSFSTVAAASRKW